MLIAKSKLYCAIRCRNNMQVTKIGTISNYYGGLLVKEEDGEYFWSIENWTGVKAGIISE